MTGFALATKDVDGGMVSVELKSVNSRFLELNIRIGDDLRAAEAPMRAAVSAALSRGKVDCRVAWSKPKTDDAAKLAINDKALKALSQIDAAMRKVIPGLGPLTAADALSWNGVVESPTADPDRLLQAAADALSQALASLQACRAREGDALRAAVLARCEAIDAILEQVAQRAPLILAAQERKLQQRLDQALGSPLSAAAVVSVEEIRERIRQEITLYGLRIDVHEELDRARAHLQEVRRVLVEGGAVGRRLDFLMQELNREANTLGSKACAVDLSHAAVELKLLIEQMREQIQNLE